MESVRISFQNNQFQRTHPQEHNKQLVTLLHQLQEILDRMTAQIVKATKDSPGTALASSLQSKGGAGGGGVEQVAKRMEAMLRAELTPFFQTCQQLISDLTAQVFPSPPFFPLLFPPPDSHYTCSCCSHSCYLLSLTQSRDTSGAPHPSSHVFSDPLT
jgi:hypothetical protein